MKKLIAIFGVAVLITGCSGNFNVNSNPDEENFDDNYQGSPEINQDDAEMIDQTGTGENLNEEENLEKPAIVEVLVEEDIEQTGTGEVLENGVESTQTGEILIDSIILEEKFEDETMLETTTGATSLESVEVQG